MKMMRYPFAALIIACFVDVAGAQELPPANPAPVVLSEQRTQGYSTLTQTAPPLMLLSLK
jgi:hypothetical protein